MANKKNGNKIWVTGAVLGAVAGAAYALWKTPMSGQELRDKLGTGSMEQQDEVLVNTVRTPTVGDKILSKIEHTLAPVVGVELGKTANGSRSVNGAVIEPIAAVEPTPAREPVAPVAPATSKEATPVESKKPTATTAPVEENPQNVGTDTIRTQRFAWGAPTPEAGLDPVPADPVHRDVNKEVPEAVSTDVGADTPTTHGSDTLRAKRFAWGDPAPEPTAAPNTESTDGRPGTAVDRDDSQRPVEAVSPEATAPGSNMRQFPKLGGLEDK